MNDLSVLISNLERDTNNQEFYIKNIKNPQLLISSLKELNNIIGNETVKSSVAGQITHLLALKIRSLNNPELKEDDVMLNTVLYGPPGVGKTMIGTILAKIWYSLGYLDGSKSTTVVEEKPLVFGDNFIIAFLVGLFLIIIAFIIMYKTEYLLVAAVVAVIGIVAFIVAAQFYFADQVPTEETIATCDKADSFVTIVSRDDFVGQYAGWSAKKTIELLNKNLGRVVFIDEAYSLINGVQDTFGIEVLSAINLFMSQHNKEIIIIFCGYRNLMESGIFSIQPGLKRRFMWHFDCSGYSGEELFDIFNLQLNNKGWTLEEEAVVKQLIITNKDAFPAYAGDTGRLTFFAEMEHSKELIHNKNIILNKLKLSHVQAGLIKLRENNIITEENNNPLVDLMKGKLNGLLNQASL